MSELSELSELSGVRVRRELKSDLVDVEITLEGAV